jgi:uncharacterized protein YdaU (DUF1376 family)
MNYYKRHIGDYAKKAGKLTMLQHGAYTLLLDACYDRERIPTLEEALEWAWASSKDEVDAVTFVHNKFFPKNESGSHIQKRVLEELLSYQSIADTNKRIAQEREAKRKSTKREPSVEEREQIVNEPPPNHKPITINHKPKKEEELSEAFVMFWNSYPRKIAKGAAIAAWKKASVPAIDVILSAVKKARQSPEWNKERGAFIPHPSTWLNQRRWEDEGMDYAALSGRGAVGASSSQESAHQIDEQHAAAWLEEVYGKVEGAGRFLEWPPNVRRDYLNQRSKN